MDTDPAASNIPVNAAGDRIIEEIRNLTNAICSPKPDDVKESKRLIASAKETDMDRGVFDRLYRLFSMSGNRRSAFAALIATVLMGSTQASTAAKVGRQKKKRRGKRSQKKRGASAQAKPGNHCIAPDGVDLNELYGMSSQFVTGFCKEVGSGEKWLAPGAPWFMSHGFDSVPDEFVPQGTTPQEDFFAKFVEIKYVVDPGTKKEKIFVLPNEGNLFKGEIDDFVVVSPSTLGDLHPLSVGKHTVETYWVLSALHCDGLADVIDENCIPAGSTLWVRVRDFSITPGHH